MCELRIKFVKKKEKARLQMNGFTRISFILRHMIALFSCNLSAFIAFVRVQVKDTNASFYDFTSADVIRAISDTECGGSLTIGRNCFSSERLNLK